MPAAGASDGRATQPFSRIHADGLALLMLPDQGELHSEAQEDDAR